MTTIKLLAFAAMFGWAIAADDAPDPDPEVVAVDMVDISPTSYAFQPSEISVRPGNVLRFRQQGVMPHNVEFTNAPSEAELDGIRMGPFLIQKGDVYEITVDGRFSPGVYEIVCTPHAALGMRAKIIVEPEPEQGRLEK